MGYLRISAENRQLEKKMGAGTHFKSPLPGDVQIPLSYSLLVQEAVFTQRNGKTGMFVALPRSVAPIGLPAQA